MVHTGAGGYHPLLIPRTRVAQGDPVSHTLNPHVAIRTTVFDTFLHFSRGNGRDHRRSSFLGLHSLQGGATGALALASYYSHSNPNPGEA